MKNALKVYINKLITYLPVAVFIFTIVFLINMAPVINQLKSEYQEQAIDVLVDLYQFYFFRTVLLTLFIPLYDFILTNKKLPYKLSIVIHCIVINVTVGILYYRPGSPLQALLIIVGTCTLIYIIVSAIILIREKKFIDAANKIFMGNTK